MPKHKIFHSVKPKDVRHGDHLRVARVNGLYWHHGYAVPYTELFVYTKMINAMRERRKKPPLPDDLSENDILIIEQNRGSFI